MASVLIQSASQAIGSSGATITPTFTLALGDLVTLFASTAGPPTMSMSDTLGTPNTYTNDIQSAPSGNGACILHSIVTHAGTCQFTVANGGNIKDVNVYQWRATNGYSTLMGTPVGGINSSASLGADGVSSSGFGTPNLITTGNALLFAGCYDQNETVATITAGTTPTSWTLRGSPIVSFVVSESAEAIGSISTPITFGISANNFDSYHLAGIAIGEVSLSSTASIAWVT